VVCCGCAASRSLPDEMNAGLTMFDGKPIQAVIDALGCPEVQRKNAGDTVYFWTIGHTRYTDIPDTTAVTCNTGEIPESPNIPVGHWCVIDVTTGTDGIVKGHHWKGNEGCESLRSQLSDPPASRACLVIPGDRAALTGTCQGITAPKF
jgi:hypothetical protein